MTEGQSTANGSTSLAEELSAKFTASRWAKKLTYLYILFISRSNTANCRLGYVRKCKYHLSVYVSLAFSLNET